MEIKGEEPVSRPFPPLANSPTSSSSFGQLLKKSGRPQKWKEANSLELASSFVSIKIGGTCCPQEKFNFFKLTNGAWAKEA